MNKAVFELLDIMVQDYMNGSDNFNRDEILKIKEVKDILYKKINGDD